jgi:hypothetical protein
VVAVEVSLPAALLPLLPPEALLAALDADVVEADDAFEVPPLDRAPSLPGGAGSGALHAALKRSSKPAAGALNRARFMTLVRGDPDKSSEASTLGLYHLPTWPTRQECRPFAFRRTARG